MQTSTSSIGGIKDIAIISIWKFVQDADAYDKLKRKDVSTLQGSKNPGVGYNKPAVQVAEPVYFGKWKRITGEIHLESQGRFDWHFSQNVRSCLLILWSFFLFQITILPRLITQITNLQMRRNRFRRDKLFESSKYLFKISLTHENVWMLNRSISCHWRCQ